MSGFTPEQYVEKVERYFLGFSGGPPDTVCHFMACYAISSENGYPMILEPQVALFSRALHACSDYFTHLKKKDRGAVFGAFFREVLIEAPGDPSFCESRVFPDNCTLSLLYFALAEALWAQDPYLSKAHDWELIRQQLFAFAIETIKGADAVWPEPSQQSLLETVLIQFQSGYRLPHSRIKFVTSLCRGFFDRDEDKKIDFLPGPEVALREEMQASGCTYVSSGNFHHVFREPEGDLIRSIPYEEKQKNDTRARDLRLLQEARPDWGSDKLRVETGEVLVMPYLPYEPSDRVMAQFLLNRFYEGRFLADGNGGNAGLETSTSSNLVVFDNGYLLQPPSLRPLSPRSNEVWTSSFLMGEFAHHYYPCPWSSKRSERAAVSETLFYLARLFTHEFLKDTFGEHLKELDFIKQVHIEVIVPHCRPATAERDKTVLPPRGLVLEKVFNVFFEGSGDSPDDDMIKSCRIDLAILLAALHSRFSLEEYESWSFESPLTADAKELPVLFVKLVGLMNRHPGLTAEYLPLIDKLKPQLSGTVLLASAVPESLMCSHVFLKIDLARLRLLKVDKNSGANAGAGCSAQCASAAGAGGP